MPTVVRPARRGEGPAIVELYEWLLRPPGVKPPDWSPTTAVSRIEDTIAGPRSSLFVAEGDALDGFCTVYLDLVSVRFGQRAWVEDLAVAEQRRSAGIGKALLDAAKSWARDHGAARLGLESGEARLEAHRFYEREQPSSRSRSFSWQL